MDFIKTSSLRALIELTFQRNWNGLIWMSRKGVIAKRVKTAPDGSIENQRRTAQTGWPRNDVPRSAKSSVRLKSRPKSKPTADHASRPGKHPAVGHATTATPSRARPCRASREQPRGRATFSRTTADASVRAGKNVPRPAEKPSAKSSSVRPHRPTVKSSGHDRSDSATTRLSGRSSRPTVRTPRSTRSRF
ncbi:unnamed protein product [Microthlaspi erraticum]|uniref:Uncharacterized protein n=1 Tax=Microthlaspi erraticum TaxID=1685480 RepID=A0A6D2KXB6_9BRAS|nr:unnamed protein product [Microthlaspi erraticum]